MLDTWHIKDKPVFSTFHIVSPVQKFLNLLQLFSHKLIESEENDIPKVLKLPES